MIGVDYMHNDDVGAFLQFRPGFYTENDFSSASFDVPMTLGRVFVLQPDRLYAFRRRERGFSPWPVAGHSNRGAHLDAGRQVESHGDPAGAEDHLCARR